MVASVNRGLPVGKSTRSPLQSHKCIVVLSATRLCLPTGHPRCRIPGMHPTLTSSRQRQSR